MVLVMAPISLKPNEFQLGYLRTRDRSRLFGGERGIDSKRDCISRFDPCGAPAAVQIASQFVEPRVLIKPPFQTDIKKPRVAGLFYVWRRERDSNPRCAINVYSLSRGALSTSQPSLRKVYKLPRNNPIHKAITRQSNEIKR